MKKKQLFKHFKENYLNNLKKQFYLNELNKYFK